MALGYAVLPIVPSVRGITREIATQVSGPIDVAGTNAGRTLGQKIGAGVATGAKIGVAAIGLVGGAVTALAAKGGIDRALNIQDATSKLVGLRHSTADVTAIMGNALDAVRGTAFGLDEAAGVAASAVAAGIKPGLDLTRVLKLTADASTIAGTGMGEMGAIFNKVITGGKLTTDVVNQLQDRGIPILQLVAQQYGVTASAASEMVTKGQVDFAHFEAAMEAGLGGAALSSGDTARGAFDNVKAALSRLGAQFAQPAVNAAPGLFQAVAKSIDAVATVLKPVSDRLGPAITSGFTQAAEAVTKFPDQVAAAGARVGALVEGARDRITGAIGYVRGYISGAGSLIDVGAWENPLQVIGQAAIAVIEPFRPLVPVLGSVGSQFAVLLPLVSPVQIILRAIGDQLPTLVGLVASLAAAGLGALLGFLVQVLPPLTTLAVNLSAGVTPALVAAIPLVVQLATMGVGVLVGVLQIVTPLIAGVTTFLSQNTGVVVAAVAAYAAFRVVTGIMAAARAAQLGYAAASYGAAGASYISGAAARIGAAAYALQNSTIVRATAGWIANTAAVATNSSLTLGTRAAIIASSVATGIATAAQWLWNAALSANPIGIIIVAIAALVAGIIWLATQTTFFQDLWRNVTAVVGAVVTWLWESVIQPVFAAIGAIFQWIYTNIIAPIIIGIALYIAIWAAIFTWLWENVLSPIFAAVGAVFTWIYNNIIAPIIAGIVAYVQLWAAIFTWLYQNIIQPAFAAIGAVFSWLYNNVIAPVIAAIGAVINWVAQNVIGPVVAYIQAAIQGWGIIFQWLYANVINPVIQGIAAAFNWVYNTVIAPVAAAISNAIRTVGSVVQSVFGAIGGFISGAFNNALGVVRGAINGIISLVNGAIGALNGISVKIPDFVPQIGGQTFGIHLSKIPLLAQGADIMPQAGGTLAVLGEAGRAETVTDYGRTNQLILQAVALASRALGSGSTAAPIVQVYLDGELIRPIATEVYDQRDDEASDTVGRRNRPKG